MELQEHTVFATGSSRPTVETELEGSRAMRRTLPVVLVCVGCGMIVASQLVRIGMSVARVLIFDRPIWSAVSLWIAALCVIAAAFLLVWSLFAPRRRAKRRMKQQIEAYGAVPVWNVVFAAEQIMLNIDGAETGMRYAYAAIRHCLETNDLFVFVTKEKQFFSVEKQTLSVDRKEFQRLIEAKCPKAKCAWRKEA